MSQLVERRADKQSYILNFVKIRAQIKKLLL